MAAEKHTTEGLDTSEEENNESNTSNVSDNSRLSSTDAISEIVKTKDWLEGQNYELAVASCAGIF